MILRRHAVATIIAAGTMICTPAATEPKRLMARRMALRVVSCIPFHASTLGSRWLPEGCGARSLVDR